MAKQGHMQKKKKGILAFQKLRENNTPSALPPPPFGLYLKNCLQTDLANENVYLLQGINIACGFKMTSVDVQQMYENL